MPWAPSEAFTHRMRRSSHAAATSASTRGSPVAVWTSQASSRSVVCTARAIQGSRWDSTSAATASDSSGATIRTAAPSSRRRSRRRAVTAPPPTMTTVRPASETPSSVVMTGPPSGQHVAAAHRDRPDLQGLGVLALGVEAGAGAQIEDLLVHRGGDGRGILSGADDAARDDVRAAVRIEVRHGVDAAAVQQEQGELRRAEQGRPAALDFEVGQAADPHPPGRHGRSGEGSSLEKGHRRTSRIVPAMSTPRSARSDSVAGRA